jgi:hypothetical protein
MHFIPQGWLPFDEASELYEATLMGERPTLEPGMSSRRFALKKAQREAPPLLVDEEEELTHLNDKFELIELQIKWRNAGSQDILRQHLYAGEIQASILDVDTGNTLLVPGQFWGTEQANRLISDLRNLDKVTRWLIDPAAFYVQIHAPRQARGPMLICKTDVIKFAKAALNRATAAASDPPVSRNNAQKTKAFAVARAFVLTFKGTGKKATHQAAKEHVEKTGLFVANADPEDWWKEFKKDAETCDLIQDRGRPRKNPENTLKKIRS